MAPKSDKPFLESIPGEPGDDFEERPNTGLQAEIAIHESEVVADRLQALLKPLKINDSTVRISPELPVPTSSIFDVAALIHTYQHNAVIIGSLKQNSEIDPLTGVYNKKAGTERALKVYENAKTTLRENETFGYIFFDIDNFGQFNKQYNQLVGDIVLRFVAQCLEDVLRKDAGQFMYRDGGEEFGVVCPKLNEETARAVPTKIYNKYLELFNSRRQELLEEINNANSGKVPPSDLIITFSAGANILSAEDIGSLTFQQMKNQADAAKTIAKVKGKNQVAVVVNSSIQI
jgi:diguanylate cyclase (GGDEF)-like protein